MCKSIKNLCLAVLFSFLVSSGNANAQMAQEQIPSEKKAVIKELLLVTDAKTNSEDLLNTMFAQMQNLLPQILITQIQDSKDIKPEHKLEASQKAKEVSDRVFVRFKELLTQKINFGQVTEQISYELYDKYFSLEEIKDLIIFYKSPTGKKAVKALPLLVEESGRKSNQILTPAIQQIMLQVLDEEKIRLLKEQDDKK